MFYTMKNVTPWQGWIGIHRGECHALAPFSVIVVPCLVALGVLAPSPARAQSLNCFPFEIAEHALWTHYGERPILQLLTNRGVMILVYADEAGASWTMVVLRQAQGGLEACQQSSGEFWQAIEWEPLIERPET